MHRQLNAPQPAATVSPQDAQLIIVQGDVELLVSRARELAQNSPATRTSVRRLYGEARRIEMLWQDEQRADQARRRAVLFKPRLAYQASRGEGKLREIERAFQPLLDATQGDRQRFQRFLEFFEALVAYMREK